MRAKTKIAIYKEHSFGYILPELPSTFFILAQNRKAPIRTTLGGSYHINKEDTRLANLKDFEAFRIYYPQYTENEYQWNKPKKRVLTKKAKTMSTKKKTTSRKRATPKQAAARKKFAANAKKAAALVKSGKARNIKSAWKQIK